MVMSLNRKLKNFSLCDEPFYIARNQQCSSVVLKVLRSPKPQPEVFV